MYFHEIHQIDIVYKIYCQKYVLDFQQFYEYNYKRG